MSSFIFINFYLRYFSYFQGNVHLKINEFCLSHSDEIKFMISFQPWNLSLRLLYPL